MKTQATRLYDIPRADCFKIFAQFDIKLTRMGSLWVEAFIPDDLAARILEKFPNSIKLLNR